MIYIIYKICIADQTYIGSTKDWKQRKITHKSACNNTHSSAYNQKIYKIIRDHGGWRMTEATPIEEYECAGKVQACIREEHWRREYEAQMNTRKAHRTREEFIQYHRIQANEYYKANVEEINNRRTEKIHCDCGATICRGNNSRHKISKTHTDYIIAHQQNITV